MLPPEVMHLCGADECRLNCYSQPRASRNAVTGIHDGALKIALTAPPVEGEANRALTEFLAKLLRIAKSQVTLASGAASRRKVVLVSGISPEALSAAVEKMC